MEVPFGSGLELAIICRLQCEAGAGRLLIYDFDGALSCQFTVPGGKSLLRGLGALRGEGSVDSSRLKSAEIGEICG